MTKYKCGHEVKANIMNTDIIGLALYHAWFDSSFHKKGTMCFKCYCDMVEEREKQ